MSPGHKIIKLGDKKIVFLKIGGLTIEFFLTGELNKK